MKRLVGLIAILVLSATTLFGQGELQVFGYFQTIGYMSYQSNAYYAPVSFFPTMTGAQTKSSGKSSSFSVQQLNLFLNKDFGDGVSAFVNFEYTSNYSSRNYWGSFDLQEAYFKYEFSNLLKAKVGWLLPKFNSLNDIYNRTPLFPYVYRPMIYEKTFQNTIPFEDFRPQRAFLQIYGTYPIEQVRLDYAVSVGNSEDSYIASENPTNNTAMGTTAGSDKSTYKSVNGRIGARYSTIEIGASASFDRDNKNKFNIASQGSPAVYKNFGDVPRTRLGFDANVAIGGLTLNGEFLAVSEQLRGPQKDSLAKWSKPIYSNVANSYSIGKNFDKMFYYGCANYEINSTFNVYAMTSYVEDNVSPVYDNTHGGLRSYSGGVGIKPFGSVVLKFEYTNYKYDGLASGDMDFFIFGTSMSF